MGEKQLMADLHCSKETIEREREKWQFDNESMDIIDY